MPGSPEHDGRKTSSGDVHGLGQAANTRKAYAADWKHFARWCRQKGKKPIPPSAETVALYLSELAKPTEVSSGISFATIERRLAGLMWNYGQRGVPLERKSRPIVTVLDGLRRNCMRPPKKKEALRSEDILAMVNTLPFDLRGLRDRAILQIGYAGCLRRSEIVGLDVQRGDTPGGSGWVNIQNGYAELTLNAKGNLCVVKIDRGTSTATCPVRALEQWLHYADIKAGPVFVRIARNGTVLAGTRLSDKHVVRLIKSTVVKSGIRAELPEPERLALFSGHSLRAGTNPRIRGA